MDRLAEMEAFVTVVDRGGFTDAATRLGMSKSAVSKHVSSLEARLGAQLLNRTTRRVSATEIGLAYYDKARGVLNHAQDADDSVTALQSSPRGTLRVSAPLSYGVSHIGPAITRFLNQHGDVTVDMELSDRRVDIISKGFDVAIRIGQLSDSSLRARKLTDIPRIIVGSPGYLRKHGKPQSLEELNGHQLLHYSNQSSGNVWTLQSPTGEERQFRVGARLTANNGDALLQAAISGLGLAYLPAFFLDQPLARGEVVQVLSDLPAYTDAVHAVYPPGRYMQPKTRAFIDFMAAHFKSQDPH